MTDVLIGLLAGAFVSGVGVVLYFVSQKKQGAQHEALKIESLLASEKKSLSDREARLLDQQKRFEEEKVRFDADRKRFETEQKDVREKRTKVDEIEMKLIQREDRLEQKMDELSKKQQALQEKESHLEKIIADQERVKVQLQEKLAQISGLSADEARKILLQQIEERYEKDILILIEKKKTELKLREKELAREILIKAIQQYSGDVTTETTQTIIHLENDDLK
jgi:ribonuclease Y